MHNRQQHQLEMRAFLHKRLSSRDREFTRPMGNGKETYFAPGDGSTYFVKSGAPSGIYQAMSLIGVTPLVIAIGLMEDGTSLLVQSYVTGRRPSRKDYRDDLAQIVKVIEKTHQCPELRRRPPESPTENVRYIRVNTRQSPSWVGWQEIEVLA